MLGLIGRGPLRLGLQALLLRLQQASVGLQCRQLIAFGRQSFLPTPKAEKGRDEMCADSWRWQSLSPQGYA